MSKASKQRSCPAVHREISPAECGANRVSHYQCPPECPFNPFAPAQYDVFTDIEAGVIRKGLDWFIANAPDRPEVLRQLDRLADQDEVRQHGWEVAEFYCRRDAKGLTRADRWLAAGLPGLKNDERVIQHATMQLRPRLFEVHRVLDDTRIEGIDLFEPEPRPFLVCDRGMASSACRFTTIFGWFFPLPHFWRVFGLAITVPPISPWEPQDAVAEIMRHLGGPDDPAKRSEWFGFNYDRFADALTATSLARREQMFAGMDAEFGKAVYELRAPFAECRDTLDAVPAVAPDAIGPGERDEGFAEARVWFDETSPASTGTASRTVLGRALLGQAHWRIEAMTGERFSRLRAQFEQVFGDRVRLTGERRDNLLARLKAKEPKFDRALVPPRLLGNVSKIILTSSRLSAGPPDSADNLASDFQADHDRVWLEESIPALDGKTPREAARDPALRPKLLRLLKEHVRSIDERNLETGGTADANALLEELGAREIIFDPPPLREAPRRASTPRGDRGEGEEDHFDGADDLIPWPPLPDRPFTIEEAQARLTTALEEFDSPTQAREEMEAAGGLFVDDVEEVAGAQLTEKECVLLEGYLIQIWFAFVPPGCFGPELEPKDFRDAFGTLLGALETETSKAPDRAVDFLLKEGSQPKLMQAMAAWLITQQKELPDDYRLRKESTFLVLLILNAVVELLDAKCRERGV